MAESAIPVDLLNPGQVFACLGIMEAAQLLLGGATGAFDWHDGRDTTFRVAAVGTEPPVDGVMRFLEKAEVVTRAPAGSTNPDAWKTSWGAAPRVDDPNAPFPFRDPSSPATLPALLRDHAGREIAIEYWGDNTRRDNVKFWAGAQGKPGAAILRDALDAVRDDMRQQDVSPFSLSAPQTISFRFDWRRDYIPVQDGFSPNKHKGGVLPIVMVGFPLVEVLAAIGMTNARPHRKTKLEYRYGVLGLESGQLLDPMFHRAALGAETSPVPGRPFRRFVMRLDWPAREGDLRSITQVSEEDTNQ